MTIRPMTVVNVEGLSFQMLPQLVTRMRFSIHQWNVDLPLISSFHAKSNLHGNRNNIWTLRPNVLCLSLSLGLIKVLPCSSAEWILLAILGNFPLKCSTLGALLPVRCKLVWSAWDFVRHTLSSRSFLRVSYRSEKITGGLTRRAFPAHIDKVVSGCAAWPEEDFSSFIEHDDLVEDIVDCLGGLIDCNRMARASKVC